VPGNVLRHTGTFLARPMQLSRLIARTVVRRPLVLIAAMLAILLGGGWIVKSKGRFDSEVLNLLPAQLESVQSLGELHNHFTQARELTFVLEGDPETRGAFEEHFLSKLRAEPWVLRVFSGPPFEAPEEMEVLQKLVAPLLLNLDETAFQNALRLIAPDAISQRIHQLRSQIEAGSPKAEFQLASDPLGLLGRAIEPLAGAYTEKSAVGGPDAPLRIIPVMTRQPTLSQADCATLMGQVEDFQKRVIASWDAPAPKIFVTGRSAYVAQMSATMQRDIQLTSTISILAVSALFFLGFRRILPLVGLTVILGMSCFTAFAFGCAFFSSLNVIAIAFCSILVGLGDDFSLLLYNRYLSARQKHADHETAIAMSIGDAGRGICYVAATTGLGFLALLLSGSAGFAQLGLLIAAGLILCAVFMILLLFLFIRPQMADERPDPFKKGVDFYLHGIWRRPGRRAIPALVICVAATIFAVLPVLPLRFDTNPRSLEPKDIPASIALRKIISAFPTVSEPVVLLMSSPDPSERHARWSRLTAHLEQLVAEGELSSFTSPLGLMLSPERQGKNQATLRQVDLEASRLAFNEALRREELNPEAFKDTNALFDGLKMIATLEGALPDLKSVIPPESSWWFLIDRFFSSDPNIAAAYLKPARPLATAADQKMLEKRVAEIGLPVRTTGWSYTMVSLVPWAQRELLLFGGGVSGLIVVLLGLAYRSWRPWALHTASLVFALAATVCTIKLAGIPINLLNAMAFPLILGVGVDYGLHLLLALREEGSRHENVATVLKPVVICGLTTITGFGSLVFARNPALSGLGLVCAVGVFWCLATSLLFLIPASGWIPQEETEDAMSR
jgi:predicted RND superfamily exporter protein